MSIVVIEFRRLFHRKLAGIGKSKLESDSKLLFFQNVKFVFLELKIHMAVCVQIDFFKSFHSYSCTKETRGTKSETPTLYKKQKSRPRSSEVKRNFVSLNEMSQKGQSYFFCSKCPIDVSVLG